MPSDAHNEFYHVLLEMFVDADPSYNVWGSPESISKLVDTATSSPEADNDEEEVPAADNDEEDDSLQTTNEEEEAFEDPQGGGEELRRLTI